MIVAVEHLTHLIRIPSVSSQTNRPVVAYASACLAQAGWNVSEHSYRDASGVDKVNLIATPARQAHEAPDVELAFVCHTDTVPYANEWTGALTPTLVDGHVHGCGACDVKGFLACLLVAAERSIIPSTTVCIVLTADEEVGCLGSKHLLAEGRLRPKRMVIGEPTSLHPARAGKGYCVGKVEFRGREAHSAHPAQGVSAIYAAARAITAIEQIAHELQAEPHAFFSPEYTTLHVGTMAGGTAKNVVPGHAEFLVEWRPVPGQLQRRVPDAIESALRSIRENSPGLRSSFTRLRDQAGFETPSDARLVTLLESLTGKAAASISFGSEASLWSSVCNEIVVFGPGDMRSAHSPRECVPVAELETAVNVIESLLTQRW